MGRSPKRLRTAELGHHRFAALPSSPLCFHRLWRCPFWNEITQPGMDGGKEEWDYLWTPFFELGPRPSLGQLSVAFPPPPSPLSLSSSTYVPTCTCRHGNSISCALKGGGGERTSSSGTHRGNWFHTMYFPPHPLTSMAPRMFFRPSFLPPSSTCAVKCI